MSKMCQDYELVPYDQSHSCRSLLVYETMIMFKMSELLKLLMKFCKSRKYRLSIESLHRIKTIQKGNVETVKLRPT